MSRRRPWRARATVPDPTTHTGAREVGRVAACTEGGLARWIERRREAGHSVQTWEVLAFEETPDTPAPASPGAPVA